METSLVFSRHMLRPRRRRATRVTVPERCYPHVKLVFAEMQRQNLRYEDVVEGSGVQRAALKAWRHKNKPGLDSIEAVLGFLGWDFIPVPRERVLPSALAASLTPIAAEHGLTMAATIEALVALVARTHERDKAAPSTAPSLSEITAPLDAAPTDSP